MLQLELLTVLNYMGDKLKELYDFGTPESIMKTVKGKFVSVLWL